MSSVPVDERLDESPMSPYSSKTLPKKLQVPFSPSASRAENPQVIEQQYQKAKSLLKTGEAKLMRRREERRKARNALIEETARLENANNPEAGERRTPVAVRSEISTRTSSTVDRAPPVDVELDIDIPNDLLDNPTVRRLAQQLQASEVHRKEVLVNCAKLENERSALIYKVEDLKDQLEDQTELAAEYKVSLKTKCRDIDKLKMQLSQRVREVETLTCQVQQREELLKEKAGIIITQLGDIMEVPLDSIVEEDGGASANSKYSIKKVEDIEKQNNQLKEEIAALRDEVQNRARNHVTVNHGGAPDADTPDYQEFMTLKRQLEKEIETLKVKLTVEERDKIKSDGQISLLQAQVKRYRTQAQESVPLDSIVEEDGGASANSKYSIKKVEDIEKQNNQLKEEIAALRDEVQNRARNHVTVNHGGAPDADTPDYQEFMTLKRQLEKEIETLKVKLTVEERDKIKSDGQISLLQAQVKRYRTQAQESGVTLTDGDGQVTNNSLS
eukprot:sb/3464056/